MYQRNYLLLLLLLAVCHGLCAQQVIPVSRYGIRPDTRADMSPRIQKMLKDLRKRTAQGEEVVLQFAPGRYDFHPDRAAERTYYISNHDQDNPKRVGIPLEGLKNVTLDGGGASFVFHGRMLPLSLLESEGCTLKNFSIDFENPHIAQVRILSADTLNGVVFRPEPWVQWRLTPDSVFEAYGEGWTVRHSWGVVFEDSTKRLVYNSGDRACPTQGARLTDGGDIHAPRWKDAVLKPGMRFVMRGWGRPTPGIFLYKDKDTRLENIRIHYAEGMGVLAQVCEDITLDRLSVCLKGKDDPRSFTTQADATHFSGCKGVISSCGGLYEGMMDDAINVHGTYLKVVQRIDDHTLVGRYMHDQSWGFHWGDPGDSVQFIRAHTMELAGTANRIVSIRPHDRETEDGAREFRITFRDAIAPEIGTQDAYGIENLTWTPQVRFAGNTVRNNRARGALFSTPRRTVVEDNARPSCSAATATAGTRRARAATCSSAATALSTRSPASTSSPTPSSPSTRKSRNWSGSSSISTADRTGASSSRTTSSTCSTHPCSTPSPWTGCGSGETSSAATRTIRPSTSTATRSGWSG